MTAISYGHCTPDLRLGGGGGGGWFEVLGGGKGGLEGDFEWLL